MHPVEIEAWTGSGPPPLSRLDGSTAAAAPQWSKGWREPPRPPSPDPGGPNGGGFPRGTGPARGLGRLRGKGPTRRVWYPHGRSGSYLVMPCAGKPPGDEAHRRLAEEIGHQANLSTQEALPDEDARVSGPDVEPGRHPCTQAEAPQGPLAFDARTGAVNSRYRLRNSADFERVRSERRGVVDPLLRLQVRPNDLGHPRMGISVSRRLGGAVERNLIRRRLRAAAASEMCSLGAFDLVMIPSPAAASSSYQQLAATVSRTLQRAGVRVP